MVGLSFDMLLVDLWIWGCVLCFVDGLDEVYL